MSSTDKTVLVTGANGYIAARTVEAFLKAGFSVRGTVRSIARAADLTAALSQYGDRFTLIEVPDITVAGAFDEAVKGVSGIAHLAAPVSLSFSDAEYVIGTAVSATKTILDSALKEPSVETVVLMSSVAAMRPPPSQEPRTVSETDWNDWSEKMAQAKGKDTPGPVIYAASKTASERAFWKFKEDKKPKFSMVALNPSFVAGPPLVKGKPDANGTNAFIWQLFSGADPAKVGLGYAAYVDIRDVARMTVFAVSKPEVSGGQRYLVSTGYLPPQATVDILRKAYPDRRDVIQEGKPGEGYNADFSYPPELVYDVSKSLRDSGEGYISLEQTVLDVAKDF